MMDKNDLENMIEMPISSQDFTKDGWKLIKKFKNSSNNYYALIRCEYCGYEKVVNYYNFVNMSQKQRPCIQCKYQRIAESEIGNIYGCTEIISVDHINVIPREDCKGYKAGIYFKVRCTRCGKETVKLFNKTNWKAYDRCNKCEASYQDVLSNRLKNDYKNNARQRNIQWNLSDEKFEELIHQNCYYCGASPELRKAHGSEIIGYANGIDRIDSSKPYDDNNVVSCCSKCNRMKNNYDLSEFLEHVSKIYKFSLVK